MTGGLRRLLVVYETEESCRRRMLARGLSAEAAGEVAFYLAQATDFAVVETEVGAALAAVGVDLVTASIDERDRWLPMLDSDPTPGTMIWCLTDGFAFYRGSFVSSVAGLLDVAQFGSPPAAQHLCQDKFRCLALAHAVGVVTPTTVLVENGEPLSRIDVLPAGEPLFVKPNRLGAKLGIAADSRTDGLGSALDLTRRIWRRYGDQALVQTYVPGRDVRVSFLDIGDGADRLGIHAVTASERGFPTLEDSLRITQLRAADGAGLTLESLDLPELADAAWRVARAAELRDYWSMDFRLTGDGGAVFLELEVCPAITIYDFLTFLREQHGCTLAQAIARAAPVAYARRPSGAR